MANNFNIPTQYQFGNLNNNDVGAVPSQYQFDTMNKPLYGDYDLGGQNAGVNTLPVQEAPKFNFNKDKFVNALAGLGNLDFGSTQQQQQYRFTPSNVDYSQFMRGLTPRTQSFYNRGM